MATIFQVWRNPLARTADRAEASARLLLTVLWLVTLPVALAMGSIAWHQVSATAEFEQRSGSSTVAQLLADPPTIALDDQGVVLGQQLQTPARWLAPDGSVRIGAVTAAAGGHSGDRIRIWVDRAGEVASQPASPITWAVLIITVTMGAALAWGAVLAAAQYGFRRRLDRRRMAGWDSDWQRIEPLWSGRSHGGTAHP
jgi:hypothetical protein